MPYFKLETNTAIPEENQATLSQEISDLVAKELGKPEKSIMVSIQPSVRMLFAGSDEPTAFIALKSLGLPDTKALSAAICSFIENKLNIPQDRIYIEFHDSPRSMFGYNGSTFE